MFRALLCPSSGARQTAVAVSGFRMNVEVEVFSAVVGLLVTSNNILGLIVASSWVFYLSALQFFPNLCTGRSLTESDDTRCCINTI
jgi:hypothetical protein